MSRTSSVRRTDFDRATMGMYVALVLIGWAMVFAVNYDPKDVWSSFDLQHTPGKQLFFIVLCFTIFFVVQVTDWIFWRTFGFVIYMASLLLLAGTIFFGREINGANAWYQLGGFSFQPAEIAKFGTCLAMATYLSATGVSLRDRSSRLLAFGIFLLPVVIILLQNDTGSALVFFSFMLVLYREGLHPSWYWLGLGSAALAIAGLVFEPPFVVATLMMWLTGQLILRFKNQNIWWILLMITAGLMLFWKTIFTWFLQQSNLDPAAVPYFNHWVLLPQTALLAGALLPNYFVKNVYLQRHWRGALGILALSSALVFAANFICYTVLAPHQQQRVKIWLRPSEITDTRGAAYNMLHSKMAIGSGGLFGKGPLNGNMTKLNYVPQQTTDFIFCTVGEEHGFFGTASLILLFTVFIVRITQIAERQRSNFSRLYAYCVAGIIFVHFIVNVGMTMGLFPIIGIPLPFISYGGSSLIGFTLMIAVLLKLDSHRNQA
jgi:rod shape determining protein RodA